MHNKEFEKLIQSFPWDQQLLNFLLIGGIAGSTSNLLIGIDLNGIAVIAFQVLARLIHFFRQIKTSFFRFYKRQYQVIVSKVTSFKECTTQIENDLKLYHQRERQIEVYYQLFFICIYFQILGLTAQLFVGSHIGNGLYMLFSCGSSFAMIFFTYFSRHNFLRHFGADNNTNLPAQAQVFQYALVILALVFWQYIQKKIDSMFMTCLLLFFMISVSANSAYSFQRIGTTSKKSYAHTLIGALFGFLSDTLYQILIIQRKEISDLLMISSILYYLCYYLLATGILLHCKAYADFFIIQQKFKYSELLKKDEIDADLQTNDNNNDDDIMN